MSARCLDNASCLPPSLYQMKMKMKMKMNETPPFEKQGIVSIVRSDFNPNPILTTPFHNSSNSIIRRNLSADMSTQIRQHDSNGFPPSPPVKRVKSSIQLQTLAPQQDHHQEGIHGPAMEDVWSSIQAQNNSWGGILSSPNNKDYGSDPGQVPPPYVHPLAKRAASSLSDNSLEICTESLGSETGSDGFSYPISDPEDSEQEEEAEVEVYDEQVHQVVHNRGPTATLTSKRSMMVTPTNRPSFPPPLPSLGNREDGSNLHIRSHRRDGRLVVEAVSVPSPNCFRARRQDGRLLLTFSRYCSGEDDEDDDEYMQEEKRVEAAAEVEEGAVVDVGMNRRSCIQGTTMRNKFTEWSNKSATWPRHYNQTIIKSLHHHNHHHHHHEDGDEEVHGGGGGVAKTAKKSWPSLPPRPITTKNTAVQNGYEYYWRRSHTTTTVGMLKPLANVGAQNHNKSTNKSELRKLNPTKRNPSKLLYAAHNNNNGKIGAQFCLEEAENLGKADPAAPRGGGRRGAAEYGDVAPWMMWRGCKEAKKPSLLLWEPYCIATS